MEASFLVVTRESYTDPTGFLSTPDSEFGEEGHIEFKNPRQVVLGQYNGNVDTDAIEAAAKEWDVSPEVLDAYLLGHPRLTPHEHAVLQEIDEIVPHKSIEEKEKLAVVLVNSWEFYSDVEDRLSSEFPGEEK